MSEMNTNTNTASRQKVKKRSQMRSVARRFRKNKSAMVGLILFLVMLVTVLMADVIVDYDVAITQDVYNKFLRPGQGGHILGTDEFGRDLFARIIHGGRVSMSVGIISVSISLLFGVVLGSVAAYYGGVTDNIIMRIVDVFLAIPSMLLAIVIVGVLGSNLMNLLLAMSISSIPRFTRIVRSSVMSIKGQEFIEAAKACGTRDGRIILKHIIPNAIGPIIVQASLNVATAVITVSSMSFLGLGISAPQPEWGNILAGGREYMRNHSHIVIVPGIAIILVVLSLNLIGDGLRDALDPKLKN